MIGNALTAEMVANHFVGYICEKKARARHVRRVAGWLGLVVLGIERIAVDWGFRYKRQFWFKTGDGRCFNVRYRHSLGGRGGLEIVDASDVSVAVARFASLSDAEAFYNRPTLAPSVRVLGAA